MPPICAWSSYNFYVFTDRTNWNESPGVYIFCGLTAQNQWEAYYIGKTENFADRLPNHDRWKEAVAQFGATHIHAIVVNRAADRAAIEEELIQRFQPPMNDLLK
jgi:excinuclease UvrABC nuclease subunit